MQNLSYLIDCPRWIQRDILHSLQRTACSRVSRERAHRATEILDEIRNPRINDQGGNLMRPTESPRPEPIPVPRPKPPMITRIFRIIFAPVYWICAAVRHVWRRRSR
jgi:hypothetical protein